MKTAEKIELLINKLEKKHKNKVEMLNIGVNIRMTANDDDEIVEPNSDVSFLFKVSGKTTANLVKEINNVKNQSVRDIIETPEDLYTITQMFTFKKGGDSCHLIFNVISAFMVGVEKPIHIDQPLQELSCVREFNNWVKEEQDKPLFKFDCEWKFVTIWEVGKIVPWDVENNSEASVRFNIFREDEIPMNNNGSGKMDLMIKELSKQLEGAVSEKDVVYSGLLDYYNLKEDELNVFVDGSYLQIDRDDHTTVMLSWKRTYTMKDIIEECGREWGVDIFEKIFNDYANKNKAN